MTKLCKVHEKSLNEGAPQAAPGKCGWTGQRWGVRGIPRWQCGVCVASPGSDVGCAGVSARTGDAAPLPASAAMLAALTPAPAGGTALRFVCIWVAELSGAEQLPA